MADALVSTPVAGGVALIAIALTAIAGKEIKKDPRENIVPLMGIMGAFVFAAQMINFSIPLTGSSGHIVGGVLLASMLGPWAAFITLVSVLLIQCLIFADGGFLALGCNIVNMAAFSTLIAYPFIFKPMLKFPASTFRIFLVSVVACIVSLELGALGVSLETELSGVTALSTGNFIALMTGIHFFIGIGEGLATAAVICFVQYSRPSLLNPSLANDKTSKKSQWTLKKFILAFAVVTILLGGIIAIFASSNPDGLEWSILKVTGETDPSWSASAFASKAGEIQEKTSLMPDYNNSLSGIVGAAITLLLAWGIGSLLLISRKTQLSTKKCADQ